MFAPSMGRFSVSTWCGPELGGVERLDDRDQRGHECFAMLLR
jgi:hypothetical protein